MIYFLHVMSSSMQQNWSRAPPRLKNLLRTNTLLALAHRE